MTDWPPITNSRLLPKNSTLFERVMADIMDVPLPNPIATLWDPQTISMELLPYLAWALGVDIWDEKWPEAKKRSVTQGSLRLHAIKGTLPGIKTYMALADSKLLKAIVPPNKTYLMPAYTRDEREAFLSMMPQLRTFLFRNNGTAKSGAFLTTRFNAEENTTHRPFLAARARINNDVPDFVLTFEDGLPILFEEPDRVDDPDAIQFTAVLEGALGVPIGPRWTRLWPRATDAALRFGKRTFLWDRGVEVDARRETRSVLVEGKVAYNYDLTFVPGLNRFTTFPSQHEPRRGAKRFLVPADAVSRTYAIRSQRQYDDREEVLRLNTVPIGAGLDPVDIRPQTIYQKGNRKGHGVYPGKWAGYTRDFLVPSTAEERIYDKIYLHDPERLPANRKRSTHLGNTRLGMPAFNAEIVAEVVGRRYVRQVGKYVSGFLVKSSREPLNKVITAIRLSKSARDKIMINTTTRRKPVAGDRLRVGTTTVGQLVRK